VNLMTGQLSYLVSPYFWIYIWSGNTLQSSFYRIRHMLVCQCRSYYNA